MNMFLVTMAAVSALAIGTPAAAQYSNDSQRNEYSGNGYPNGYADENLSARIGQLDARLQSGIRSGSITRAEAMPLRQQLRRLAMLERQYSVDGTSGRERTELQQRVRTLRQDIRTADGGNQARWDGYDREDGYGRWDQSDRDGYDRNNQYDPDDRMDRNNDGYDDRDYNRDGRRDDAVDNGYQQQPRRGGIGGFVDALLGTGGLRVGQQAPANLYGVPYEYRGQYRDGNGTFYRSDGRQIYQIDARTQSVVRIYAMNR